MTWTVAVLFFIFFIHTTLCETIKIKAVIECPNRNAYPIAIISLWDEDFTDVPILKWFDKDDRLDDKLVAYGQYFELTGSEIEIFSTEPYIAINHRCNGNEQTFVMYLDNLNRNEDGDICGRFVLRPAGIEFHSD